MDSKKKLWTLTDAWELGYDFTCPSCLYTFFMGQKFGLKPEECPKCKSTFETKAFRVADKIIIID